MFSIVFIFAINNWNAALSIPLFCVFILYTPLLCVHCLYPPSVCLLSIPPFCVFTLYPPSVCSLSIPPFCVFTVYTLLLCVHCLYPLGYVSWQYINSHYVWSLYIPPSLLCNHCTSLYIFFILINGIYSVCSWDEVFEKYGWSVANG